MPRLSGRGDGPPFDDLVRKRSTDIRSRVVPDEWLRLGIVRLDEDRVSLVAEAFVPQSGIEEKLRFFSHKLGDHMDGRIMGAGRRDSSGSMESGGAKTGSQRSSSMSWPGSPGRGIRGVADRKGGGPMGRQRKGLRKRLDSRSGRILIGRRQAA